MRYDSAMAAWDAIIPRFDRALRTVCGVHRAGRPSPGRTVPEGLMSPEDRAEAAALMRVNHAGEICAQALYEAQAATSRDPAVRAALRAAAIEEEDHLAWCDARIRELGGRTSALASVWYAGAFAIGALAGAAGDRWSLAFLAETEHQVESHLQGHLDRLSPADARTREVVRAMQCDERGHREAAIGLGAPDMPAPVRFAMRQAARVMTAVAHRV